MRQSFLFRLLRKACFFVCSLLILSGVTACTSSFVTPTINSSQKPQSGPVKAQSGPTFPMRISNEGTVIYTYHTKLQIDQVAWSSDSQRVASLEYNFFSHTISISIWDAFTGQHLVVYPNLNAATFLAWSPKGEDLAVAMGKAVEIWDVSTGRVVLTYTGHLDTITALAWSPDGRYIATGGGGADKTVRVWNSQTGQTVSIYKGYSAEVQTLTWSPDSKRIASFAGGLDINAWDATTGANQRVYALAYPSLLRVKTAWSPDGTRLAVSRQGGVDLWNVATGKIVLTYHGYAKDEAPQQVLWSPDSQRIASSGGYSDPSLQIWDTATGNFVFHYRTDSLHDDLNYAAWSPNGKYIATAGLHNHQNTAQIWDASPGREALVYRGHTGSILSVAWSPNGKYIASASAGDFEDKTLHVWEAATGRTLFVYQSSSLLGPIAWSPDSTRLAVGNLDEQQSMVHVFDALTGSHPLTYSQQSKNGGIYSVSWSPDGKSIASGDSRGTITIWNAQTGKLETQDTLSGAVSVSSLAWSPDGHYLAAASADLNLFTPVLGAVTILKITPVGTNTGIETAYNSTQQTGSVYTVSWSPDGKYIVFGGQDQTVQIREALTGKLIFTYRGFVQQKPDSVIQQVAWSPNGQRIVAVSYGQESANSSKSVQVWDATNGGHVYIYTGHLDKVGSVAWSPDGQYIVTGSADSYDPTVQIWLDQR